MPASLIVLDEAIVAPLNRFAPPGPAGQHGSFNGGAYFPDGRVCQLGLSRMINHDNQPDPAPVAPEARLDGLHLWCGLINNLHFGHFISESLARLWALDTIRTPDSLVFFTRLPAQPLPGWARGVIEMLAPGIALTQLRAPARVERLVVPDSLSLPSGVMRGEPLNRDFLHRRLLPPDARIDALWQGVPPGARKLYVSRARLASEAQILHEDRIEALMAQEGYRILYPETETLADQLALYRGADRLVFAEGSALHVYALVCRPDQKLFTIWRRKTAYGGFANQIRSFGGPEVQGSIHIRDVLVPRDAPQALARAHGIPDLPSLSAELQREGFISAAGWAQPDALSTRWLMMRRYAGFVLA